LPREARNGGCQEREYDKVKVNMMEGGEGRSKTGRRGERG